MAGVKGMQQVGCRGLSDEEIWTICEKKYSDFCTYRQELFSHMPDNKKCLFGKRVFYKGYFEII